MEEIWAFALARYNYWIVIVLMMVGLYIVFSRGNLVKKLVGLNLFQTSVFIFYISIGKVAGGTAPIYMGDELYYGGGHDEPASLSAPASPRAGHHDNGGREDVAERGALHDDAEVAREPSAHAKIANPAAANDLKRLARSAQAAPGSASSLHAGPDHAGKIANRALGAKPAEEEGAIFALNESGEAPRAADAPLGGGEGDGDHSAAAPIRYSNPLPHVLILTAIVVGVAGMAVGLALAVRIREAYGTIEEDELEAIDNVAEFGGESDTERAQAGAPS